jgi:hypothetical protein
MAKFKKKSVVEAVQLRWDTWKEMCEHAGVGKLTEGKPEGCYVDAEGRITDDSNGHLGLRVPGKGGSPFSILGVEGDWIIRGINGELYSCKPDVFAATYEKDDDYKTDFEPDWRKYPKLLDALLDAFEIPDDQKRLARLETELRNLIIEARADALRYANDVKVNNERGVSNVRREVVASIRLMTDAQLIQSIKNVGCDLACVACAEVFFTGTRSGTYKHTCPKEEDVSDRRLGDGS